MQISPWSECTEYDLKLASVEPPPSSPVSSKPSKSARPSILSGPTARTAEETLQAAVVLTSHNSRQEAEDDDLNRKNFFSSLKCNSTSRTVNQNKALRS